MWSGEKSREEKRKTTKDLHVLWLDDPATFSQMLQLTTSLATDSLLPQRLLPCCCCCCWSCCLNCCCLCCWCWQFHFFCLPRTRIAFPTYKQQQPDPRWRVASVSLCHAVARPSSSPSLSLRPSPSPTPSPTPTQMTQPNLCSCIYPRLVMQRACWYLK